VGRIILSIVLLVILAVVVALNATYTTGFNLFGYKIEEVSIVAVGLSAFVLGVIYSFLLYSLSYLEKRRRARLKDKQKAVRQKETQLGHREEAIEEMATREQGESAEETPQEGGTGLLSGRRKRRKKG
jgi:uncharacterized integral membrane protein